MSGVLERMILRTRSALAGIEPLFAPRYAASEGFREPGDRPTGAPAPRQRQTARTARTIAPDRAMASSPVAPAFSEEGARATSWPRQEPVVDEVPGSLSTAPADVSSDSVSAPLPAGPRQAEEPAARAPPLASARTVSADDAITRSARSRIALTNDAASPAGPVLARVSKQRTAPQPPAFAANGEASAAPPHVTISIGHVEIRAAPVSPPPRRPSFRPRMTLDEYLGRRTGDSR